MSVWEKVFKNTKSKGVQALGSASLSVPDLKLPKRTHQLPGLFIALAMGSTFTKRTFLCQLGAETMRWNPEEDNSKIDLSVFRVEKIINDNTPEISLGEEALSNFMSDRGDPGCTLFLQPSRFLLSDTKLPSYVTTTDSQKILHQSPSTKDLYKHYIKAQLGYLWEKAHSFYSEVRRFRVTNILVECPDYFVVSDYQKFKSWLVEAAEEFFPPILSPEEETTSLADRIILLPEAVITFLHWLTDHVEAKLAMQELDLKKLLAQHGILPRPADPINFLVVSMGGTHSRVVRIRLKAIDQIASAKRVGETVTLSHSYLGRTGFGGDHLSCAFLDEEEERRYGGSPASRVSTLTRKVFEDWGKLNQPEGRRHFDELCGDQYLKALEKLGELTMKGFSESPENTIIILGGKAFAIPHLRDVFKKYLNEHRIPMARLVTPSSEEISIERVSEIYQFHQKGLGRSFSVKSGLDTEGVQRFTWRIGKVVEGTLVDTILSPDNKEWDSKNPREFTLTFEHGVRHLNLGYQKTAGGISQLWARIQIQKRVISPVHVTFRTEAPDDLKIIEVKCEGKSDIVTEDIQIDMMMAGEHPSHFPLYDKVMKSG